MRIEMECPCGAKMTVSWSSSIDTMATVDRAERLVDDFRAEHPHACGEAAAEMIDARAAAERVKTAGAAAAAA